MKYPQYQSWGKLKFFAVLVGVFTLGVIMSASGSPEYIAAEQASQPEVKTVEVIKEIKVADRESLSRLDAIDQEIFNLSTEVIGAQTKALQVAGSLLGQYPMISIDDFEAGTVVVTEQTAIIKEATAKVEAMKSQRKALLNQ